MDQKVLQKIGKYEIVSELGQGGMGVVYLARDPFIGREVALKTISPELVADPEMLKRFYREAQSAGTLQHRNIVTIYDLGEAESRPYIAMEFIRGESFENIIKQGVRFPLAAKLKLVQQICEGLGFAHRHGVIHRDVKPANILVTNDGVVKMLDFGIAHLESANITRAGNFLGTVHYASPEQLNGGRVDGRSDLWSVAAVFYELVAYKKAFEGSNLGVIIAKVLTGEPEPLSICCPGVPQELDGIISKGLAKRAEDRYASLDEMQDDLLPIARRLQQTLISDLMEEAKALRDQGDIPSAKNKVRAILILDNTNGDAIRLYSEMAAEIRRQRPALESRVSVAEQASSGAEPAESVATPREAQALNPADARARELREALISGQRAMKQGDLTGAEKVLHRVLELDQTNAQAAQILEQIRHDRQGREHDFQLKEGLWSADKLLSAGKYAAAQDQLLALQQEYPNADEILQKLKALDPLVRSAQFVEDAREAFNQGEFGEAVRALTQALELNPQDKNALDLKNRALKERDRLRQVREALAAGQRALRNGDENAAAVELKKVLDLDPSHAQGIALMGQIRQGQAAREQEAKLREALQQADKLVAEKKFEESQFFLMDLQQSFPDSTEIDKKLQGLDGQMKLHLLVADGEQAFNHGEFGEAVRILSEAQELAPGDERVRDLRVRAVQERDRLRQVREAIAGGQRALRQGLADVAEQQFQRALQLDPANAQATGLLAQLRTGRQAQDREQKLKADLSRAENLISALKLDEAERSLNELQNEYPGSEPLRQMFEVLKQKRAEATAPPPVTMPAAAPAAEKSTARPAPAGDYARSMQLAEELRLSLQKLGSPSAARPVKRPTPASASSATNALTAVRGTGAGAPPPKRVGESSDVTLLRGSSFHAHITSPEPLASPPPEVPSTTPSSESLGPVVTLIPPAEYPRWDGPVEDGQMIPAQSVEGGVQPVQLTMPSIADAPPKAEVVVTVTIDTEGNVTSADTTGDDHGLTPQVVAAAKSWKFAPPKAKGMSVKTSVQVKVVF